MLRAPLSTLCLTVFLVLNNDFATSFTVFIDSSCMCAYCQNALFITMSFSCSIFVSHRGAYEPPGYEPAWELLCGKKLGHRLIFLESIPVRLFLETYHPAAVFVTTSFLELYFSVVPRTVYPSWVTSILWICFSFLETVATISAFVWSHFLE